MIVYKATNNINGKSYIGQTIHNLKVRKSGHIRSVLHKDTGMYFHSALKKYGFDNFTWETLHWCNTIEELNKLEIHYIKLYDTFGNGYNLNTGGGNAAHSEETKRKMSKLNSGKNNPNYGKHLSEETKRKISKALSGKNHPFYGKTGKDSPFYGKKLSIEHRKKISNNSPKLSGKNHPMARAVIINNNFFSTCKEAAEKLKIPASTIRYRIKNHTRGYQYGMTNKR